MKLNGLIARLIKESRKNTSVEGGLFLLTVEHKAMAWVRSELPEGHFDVLARDVIRDMRTDSVKDRTDWPRVVVECHNPHIMLTNEADISLHVWKDGDNINVRCEKFRSLEQRPSDIWAFIQEVPA